ncbi:hypothetical protein [Candidatus Borrarchaeum sp.]|uniref:hypothetical protein n=1 Tax=Candidatus Borrarchaeum sp. TaxID=2846742 RepID=UPI00257B53CD|nr:hypothetical protein [Candidatus Borrarchaeum sp.]
MDSTKSRRSQFRPMYFLALFLLICLLMGGLHAPNSLTVIAEQDDKPLSTEDDFAGIKVLIDQVKSENRSLHSMVGYLEAEGASVDILEDKVFNIKNIQEYDILILIEPLYDPSAEKVIEKYVKNGGSVLFSGDNRWEDYTKYVDFANISYQKPNPSEGYTKEINGHPATLNVQEIYCAEPQSSLIVGTNASTIVMKDGYVEAAAAWIENGKFMVVADEHILLDDYYKSGDNHLFMHSILKWLRNIGFSIDVTTTIKKGEQITVQAEFVNYRTNEISIKAITESKNFEEINNHFVLQPGINEIEFQLSENIIELFFLGEKELTLKFEYNGRTLFSEDSIIDVQYSSIYIGIVAAPLVFIGLILLIFKINSKRSPNS